MIRFSKIERYRHIGNNRHFLFRIGRDVLVGNDIIENSPNQFEVDQMGQKCLCYHGY